MQPTSPLMVAKDGEPNIEFLQSKGWAVSAFTGHYCVAWRGRDEVVLEWKGGGWHRVGGRGAIDEL